MTKAPIASIIIIIKANYPIACSDIFKKLTWRRPSNWRIALLPTRPHSGLDVRVWISRLPQRSFSRRLPPQTPFPWRFPLLRQASDGGEVKAAPSDRPPYSYMAMIQFAINSRPDRRMTLKDIYTWIEDHFPFFQQQTKPGWKVVYTRTHARTRARTLLLLCILCIQCIMYIVCVQMLFYFLFCILFYFE